MKRSSAAGVCFILLLVTLKGKAQAQNLPHLEITTTETTLIVSHYQIRSVDRGSRDILAQKVKGVDTVLEVKAARPDFPETNLTIVTGDGKVHMFLVGYDPKPSILWYPLLSEPPTESGDATSNAESALTEAAFKTLSDSVLQQRVRIHRTTDHSLGVRASLAGIYIHEEVLFFRLRLKNSSHIPYDISQLNFYIRDKKQSKRTASQDLSLTPLFYDGDHRRLEGHKERDLVVALPAFTIPEKKVLYIVMKEKNGGRLLRLRVRNKVLIRAREI